VHWTTDLWTCIHCGVSPGQTHQQGCAVRNTAREVVWFGPPVTDGMLPRLVVEGDVTARYLSCLACERELVPGEVIFENRSQSTALHANCVLQLAQMIPREVASPDEVESEFERRRAEILDRQP
jgi:hypothetical protein